MESKKKVLNTNIIFFIILLIVSGLSVANGQDFKFKEPDELDLSRSFLNQIFGSLLDGGQNAFGNSITYFNSAILIVGGILASYTIFSAMLGTAHDGEMLGKKFSSVWIPIRYTMGTALVLPVLSGGYCVMQGLVMWLIMQGVSLANGVWGAYMSNPPGLSQLHYKSPPDKLIKFIEDTYLMNVCVAGNEKVREGGGNSIGSAIYTMLLENPNFKWEVKNYQRFSDLYSNPIDQRANQYINFGVNRGILNSMKCGEINYMLGKDNTNRTSDSVISDSTKSTSYRIPSMDKINKIFKSPDYNPILIEHYNQTDLVVQKTMALAQANIGKGKQINYEEEYKKLYKIAEEYNNAIIAKSREVSSSHEIEYGATKEGWFLAGAWITQIIVQQNKVNTILNAIPSVSKVNIDTGRNSLKEEFTNTIAPALNVVQHNSYAKNYLTKALTPKEKDGEKEKADGDIVDVPTNISVYLAKFVSGIDLNAIKHDDRHPIIIMSTIGNSILTAIMTGVAFVTSAAVVAVAWSGFVSLFVTFYGTFALPLFGFISVGATLAYIIPNLPFILWLGIIIGWTVLCVEAIIIAPLWAVMHLHPNGDDLTGKGGSGYMLLLGLVLRPVLIIFGLISAITLSGLFGQLVNMVFLDIFMMNQGDASLGFISSLFCAGLYGAMMFVIIKQTFNLMHSIPDNILKWIGGGKEQLGQYAGESMESMAKSSVIGGSAAGLATGSAFRGVKGVTDDIQNKMHKNELKERNSNFPTGKFGDSEISLLPEKFQNISNLNGENEEKEPENLDELKAKLAKNRDLDKPI